MEKIEEIKGQVSSVLKELIEKSGLYEGQLLVIGCSTSEIIGSKIGTDSVPEIAEEIVNVIYEMLSKRGIFLAAQCCEHLNRALIIESEYACSHGLQEVNVIPQPKAGGSFATAVYKKMKHPVAIEHVKADAGLDIGQTLIGMHLKDVAVPLRLRELKIGSAIITAARVRPKFIGGCRAVYDETKL